MAVADWATISSLATAGGTLVLAAATFASVRSANRAARLAEQTLQIGVRPLLMASRLEDPVEKIMWGDEHWAELRGGHASVEIEDGNVYLAMSVRNVGAGIAVIQGWHPTAQRIAELARLGDRALPSPDDFRPQQRDLYVPAGDASFWQAAIRDPNDQAYAPLLEAIGGRQTFTITLLYSDHEGGQRTISRFALSPRGESEWLCSVNRHRNLDRPNPR
jgi:hypothetical protein